MSEELQMEWKFKGPSQATSSPGKSSIHKIPPMRAIRKEASENVSSQYLGGGGVDKTPTRNEGAETVSKINETVDSNQLNVSPFNYINDGKYFTFSTQIVENKYSNLDKRIRPLKSIVENRPRIKVKPAIVKVKSS